MEDKIDSTEPRQRKKKLINEVKETLDFYFSPANVSKDKFMRNLLEENEAIDLETFLKFNKLKGLTSEVKIIKKAVKKSEILELSEDELHVKRKVPIEFKSDEMECTVYVENLPPNSSHEWLQKVFSPYGTIDYISLPRFQRSGRPKGFAFVEYSNPQEAQKALEAFGGLASLDGTLNPSDLLTIKTYGQLEEKVEESGTAASPSMEVPAQQISQKRSASTAFEKEDAESEEEPLKKARMDLKEEPKKKKKRKRNKKEKEYELNSVYLRVISKREWKTLRNKYLNLQKENMKQLKQQYTYGIEPEQKKARSNQPQFISGVIVKLTLSEPPQDPTAFREGLTHDRTSISYVDINSQNPEVFVRFKTSDAAKEFVTKCVWENVELLTGEEEQNYWEKILDLWNQKRPSKKRITDNGSNHRGREKLIAKALKQKDKEKNSHVVFED